MTAPLKQPGPGKDGFQVHVLVVDAKVRVVFGVEVNHLPMPPHIAWRLGQSILSKAREIDPDGKLTLDSGGFYAVQVYDKQVLLELTLVVSELTLSPATARDLGNRLIEMAAKAVGRPIL